VKSVKFLILGAGPTGLGAAWRLSELSVADWLLLEAASQPGGLAASFMDEQGFTWDIGGHVQFSHYEYFDRVMDQLLGPRGWVTREREAWVWMRDRFIPYPLQNNIRCLPADDSERCLAGLLDISRAGHPRPHNFHQWIMATFGPGLANVFMLPYNFKVWAHPLEMLDVQWVGERVAPPDARSGVSWGPNRTFRFPVRGGTGAIWRSCAQCLPQGRLRFDTTVTAIDLDHRQVTTATGERYRYDALISSIPLTELIRCSGQSQFARRAECGLLYSSSNIFGIGLSGKPAEELRTKSWVYFPEDNCPFYRVTVFSNYSSNNVPDSEKHWSLIAEVSESQYKPVDRSRLLEQVIAGLLATGFVTRRDAIVSTWQYRAPYGYPTPALNRDAVLAEIVPFFESQGVYSRGRFGLWKYEVSNQDHSFMQGVEIVERLVNGRQEITAFDARCANGRKHAWPFVQWETGLSARVNSGEADGVGKK
jgi:protoporphyrinogen oxidase